MSRKQLVALFVCSLFPWILGNGLVPLLPVYAKSLGASSAAAGAYLAVSYLGLALGALSAGWVSNRFGRKTPLMVISFLAIPINLWLGSASSLLELTLATFSLWYLGGMGLALINIIAGLFAPKDRRGRTFGILGLAVGLGSVIGGFSAGPLVDALGYSGMFFVFAFITGLWFLSVFFVEDQKNSPQTASHPGQAAASGDQETGTRQIRLLDSLGIGFLFLLLAMFLAALANFTGILGRSLVMDDMGFSTAAITSTAAISAIFHLPVAPLVGSLSDRVGRRKIVWAGYLSGAIALFVMAFSRAFWQFSLAIFLLSLYTTLTQNVANAWTVDLVPPQSLGRGLAIMGAIGWFGGVFGFALGGMMIQSFGAVSALLGAAGLFVAAAGLLIWVRSGRKVSDAV
jgi:MFS family permease